MQLRIPILLLIALAGAPFPLFAETLPADARPLALEASSALQKKDYATAESKYQAILQIHPDCFYAWSNLGVTYFQDRQLQKALSAFQKAAAINPQDSLTSFHLGMTFYEIDAFTEAEQNLKTYVVRCPTDPGPHGLLALIYKKQNRPDEANREQVRYQELMKTRSGSISTSSIQAI